METGRAELPCAGAKVTLHWTAGEHAITAHQALRLVAFAAKIAG